MDASHEVPEELFLGDCHGETSTSIRTAAGRAAWSNPKNRKRVVVPQLECLRGYVDAVKINQPVRAASAWPARLCSVAISCSLGKIGLLLKPLSCCPPVTFLHRSIFRKHPAYNQLSDRGPGGAAPFILSFMLLTTPGINKV